MHRLLQNLRAGAFSVWDKTQQGARWPLRGAQWYSQRLMAWTLLFIGFVIIPSVCLEGNQQIGPLNAFGRLLLDVVSSVAGQDFTQGMSVESVNQLGRYLCFAIVAVSLNLVWGKGGMLSLCQFLFFALGGYAMGMFLAHHGGPEGIIDSNGWKIPSCLYVVYPYSVGEAPGEAVLPWFWKPFWNLPATMLLGLLIPGLVALAIGYSVFRSRVRGVFFAVLTQAIVLAVWLVFCMNSMKLCGTNGLTRFDRITFGTHETIEIDIDAARMSEAGVPMTKVESTLSSFADGTDGAELVTEDRSYAVRVERSRNVWTVRRDVETLTLAANGDGRVLVGDVADVRIGGIKLTDPKVKLGLYVVTLAMLVIVYLSCRSLVKSRFGRVLVAIRDNESRLRFSGYKPHVFKTLVFGLSGMIAGLGGMLYAPQMSIFTPTHLEPKASLLVVVWVAVGGRGKLSGAILGALTVNYAYSYLTTKSPDAWPFVLGALFVAVVCFFPDGLISIWRGWTSARLSGPENDALDIASESMSSSSGELRKWDRLVTLAGVISVAIGLYAAITLWQYGRPFEGGLLARRNGSQVVMGLLVVGLAFCGFMSSVAGIGMLLGRQCGLRLAAKLPRAVLSITITVVVWHFYVDTLAGGIGPWFEAGVLRVVSMVRDVPSILLIGVWAITGLFFLKKVAVKLRKKQGDREAEGKETTRVALNGDEFPDSESRHKLDAHVPISTVISSPQDLAEEPIQNGALLQVENVKVYFDGFLALDIDDYAVSQFGLDVVIGPNGAGKTTLCDVISGKTRAAEGRVLFGGRDITQMPDVEIARLGIGRKFQTPNIFDSLTVYQNMELSLPRRDRLIQNIGWRTTAKEHDRIKTILERVRLLDDSDTFAKYLSHGRRQWLEISMLVIASRKLLLVDEPAAGLSDKETEMTAELLLELKDSHSILVIEHDMDFVRMLDTRVTVLNEGKIMAQGTMDEVASNDDVQEAYLGR